MNQAAPTYIAQALARIIKQICRIIIEKTLKIVFSQKQGHSTSNFFTIVVLLKINYSNYNSFADVWLLVVF
jgi:hypothetical protein